MKGKYTGLAQAFPTNGHQSGRGVVTTCNSQVNPAPSASLDWAIGLWEYRADVQGRARCIVGTRAGANSAFWECSRIPDGQPGPPQGALAGACVCADCPCYVSGSASCSLFISCNLGLIAQRAGSAASVLIGGLRHRETNTRNHKLNGMFLNSFIGPQARPIVGNN